MPMSFPRRRLARYAVAASLSAAGLAAVPQAQSQTAPAFPTRPVKLVVPFPAGGATDLTARLLAGKLAEAWGQPVVVENKPGASGMIGSEQVARAPADGYSILVTITTHIQNPALFAKIPYDALKDFEPISQICLSYLVLAVKPEFPARDLKEFIALTRANPPAHGRPLTSGRRRAPASSPSRSPRSPGRGQGRSAGRSSRRGRARPRSPRKSG